jgi:hypothetical protein
VGGVRRGLLRFDLSGIPLGSTVTSAVVRLTVVKVPGTGGVNSTFDLFRLQAGWGEGNKIGNAGALVHLAALVDFTPPAGAFTVSADLLPGATNTGGCAMH